MQISYSLLRACEHILYNLYMTDCIFCKIISGEIKSQIIYEDDFCVAFKDLNPQAPTHILIVPKKHIENIAAAAEEDALILGKLQLAAAKIAKDNNIKDFRLVANNGKGAGQSVMHLHYHLMAGRRFLWPAG